MIVLNVTYECKAGMREKFLDAIKAEGLDTASRAEEGNFKYDYYYADGSPDELLLVEWWRDEDAVRSHNAEPHFKRLGELKGNFVDATIIKRYSE